MFKNMVSIAMPEAMFLCAQANEIDSNKSIFEMGGKLASEIDKYIEENCPGTMPSTRLARLSFIGYSMGGLIMRAALPHLEKYRDKMHGLMTMGSPHLGYMYK